MGLRLVNEYYYYTMIIHYFTSIHWVSFELSQDGPCRHCHVLIEEDEEAIAAYELLLRLAQAVARQLKEVVRAGGPGAELEVANKDVDYALLHTGWVV